MPRPYNFIRGEGTVKNQRWGLSGLGSYMDTPFVPGLGNAAYSPYIPQSLVRGFGDLTAPCPGGPGCPGGEVVSGFPDVEQQIADLWDYVFTNAPINYDPVTQQVSGNTVGGFIAKNWPLVAGGVLLVLFARR